jgi:UPF0755 protein
VSHRARVGLCALVLACGPERSGPVERVVIPTGSSFRQAADSLDAHRLLGSRVWFTTLARLGRYDRAIQPGLYEFRPGTGALALLRALSDGDRVVIRFTVPEGASLLDVAALASERLYLPRDSVLAAARDTALLRELRIDGPSAEGFLWPDTYLLSELPFARDLIVLMHEAFRRAWQPAWDSAAQSAGRSRLQVLTLASIVEGEARVDDERAVIAGIYLNRLRIGMPLQADPTVQYAIQLKTGERKPRLYTNDYAIASPYNSYLHPGLPPGPVGAPSRKSIEAVLWPANVPWLYLVAGGDGDGRHVFSRTYDDHLRAVRRVRRNR